MNTTLRNSLLAAAMFSLVAMPAVAGGDKGDKFHLMDTDGDGKVSRAEHAAGAKLMFEQCDADRDGIVTAMEMDAVHGGKDKGFKRDHMKRPDDEKPAGRADKPAHGEKPWRGDRSSDGMGAAEKIKMIDTDGDGRLTASEHEMGSDKMFAKMDSDGDGFLSQEEMKAGHKMKEKKRDY